MADDIKFDDDLNDDLGGDMMDFDLEAQNDDRNPATIFRQSALNSVKTTMTDPGFIGEVVKDALPKGYRSALDVADKMTGDIKTVYNESAQALKPSIDEFKRNAQAHLPKIKKILPDSLGNKVEKLLEIKSSAESTGPTKEQVQDSQMHSDLDKLFQVQAASVEGQEAQQTQEILQNTITEQRETVRHEANMTANERMIAAFNRLVSYQDNITSQFQRRLLELNYRQYFAQRDLVDIARAGFTDLANALSAIVKNTALPDEAKVNLSETYADMARERLAGKALESVSTRIAGISSRVRNTLGQKVKQHVDNFKEGLNQGNALLQTASSMEGLEGFGPKQTGAQQASDLVGGIAGQEIATRIGAKISGLAGRALENNPRAMQMSNRLQVAADNIPELLNRYASSETDATGLRGNVESFLKEIIGGVQGTDGEVLQNLKQEALSATSFDVMTRRSIVEIIPGYLSRMLQQLEIFNNQDPNTERLQYSVDGEDFVRESTQSDRIREAVFSTSDRERLSSSTVDVINSIDPEGKLSQEAREAFSVQILTDLRNGKGYFPERYYQESTFTSVDNEDAVKEIQDFVKERYVINKEGKVGDSLVASQNVLNDNRSVKRLQEYLPNLQESINEAVAVGDKDALRESGLITKDRDGVTDMVDSDALWSMIQSDISNTLEGRDIISEIMAGTDYRSSDKVTGISSTDNTLINRSENSRLQTKERDGIFSNSTSTTESGSQSDLLESIREIIVNNSITSQSNNNLVQRGYGQVTNVGESSTTDIQRTISENIKDLDPATQVEVRESVKAFTNEVDPSDTSDSTLGVWSAIHDTLIKGNGLTTSLIARIDTWMNRDINLEEDSSVETTDPHLPYLMAIQDRSVSSDTTLTDIKLLIAGLSEKITTLGSGGPGDSSGSRDIKLGGILGKGLDLGKSAIGGAASGLKSYYSGMFNLGGSALGVAKDTVLGGAKFIKGKFGNLPGDLYIAGQQIPTLLGDKLRQGKYIDEATGKIIKSAKDITGAVRDVDTGEIVLSVEDYAKGLFNKDGVSKMAGAAKSILKAPVDFIQSYYRGLFGIGEYALKGVTNIASGVENMLNRHGDIYVKGEDGPRLLKILLEKGMYYSARTGNVIRSIKDIDGDVVDADGNIVLSVEDIKKGLVDEQGRKIEVKSLLTRALEFGKDTLQAGVGVVTGGIKRAGKFLFGSNDDGTPQGGLFSRIGGMFTSITEGISGFFTRPDGMRVKEVIIHSDLTKVFGPWVDGNASDPISGTPPPIPPASRVSSINKDSLQESRQSTEKSNVYQDNYTQRDIVNGETKQDSNTTNITSRQDQTSRFFSGLNSDNISTSGQLTASVLHDSNVVRIEGTVPLSPTDKVSSLNENILRESRSYNETASSNQEKASEKDTRSESTTTGYSNTTSARDRFDSLREKTTEVVDNVTKASKEVKDKHLYTLLERGQEKTSAITKQVMSQVNDVTQGLQTQIRDSDSTLSQNMATLVESSKDAYTVVSDKATDASMRVKDSIESLKETILNTFKKEKVAGDADGDGIRDGSYLDQRNKETLAEKAKATIEKSGPGAAVLGGVAGFLGGLKDKIKGFSLFGGDDAEDEDSFLGDVASEAAGDLAGDAIGDRLDGDKRQDRKRRRAERKAAKRAGKAGGKRGLFSKIKSLGGKALGGIGSLIKSPGKALLGAGTALAGLAGSAVSGIGSVLGGAGSLAAKGVGALGGVGSMLGTLGKIGMAVGRVALGPVGWAATGLYYGYKGAKYLASRSDADPIEDLRFKQMGINTEDGAQLRAIRLLEESALDDVTYAEDGQARIPKVDYNDLIDEFGDQFNVDQNNPQNLEAFVRWYEGTFKPTLLTYATLANRVEEGMDVDDLDDDLPDGQHAEFAKHAYELLESSPAIGNTSPFYGQQVDSSSVTEQYNKVMQEYGGAVEDKTEVSTDSPSGEPVVPPEPLMGQSEGYVAPPGEMSTLASQQPSDVIVEPPVGEMTRKMKAAALVAGGGMATLAGMGGVGMNLSRSGLTRIGGNGTTQKARQFDLVSTTGIGLGALMGGTVAANADNFSGVDVSKVKMVDPIIQRDNVTTPKVYNVDGSLYEEPEDIAERQTLYRNNVDTRNMTTINEVSKTNIEDESTRDKVTSITGGSNIYTVNMDEVINQQRLRNQQSMLDEETRERVVLDDHIATVGQFADRRVSAVDNHQRMYSEIASEQMSHISTILSESLYVQQSMDDTLKRIHAHITGERDMVDDTADTSGGTPALERAKQRQADAQRRQQASKRTRSQSPVSMGKSA